MIKFHQSPVQEIEDDLLRRSGIRLFLKREDLIHKYVSGNKWRKLKYNLEDAAGSGHSTLLTFGGAYSNHIHATAAAAREAGFRSIGIIRGEETLPLNPTLEFATGCGMELEYISRENYRNRDEPELIESLKRKFGKFYLLPEGGTNLLALKGCAEIIDEIDMEYDMICVSVGTGGTLAGIISGLKGRKKAIGYSMLKGDFLREEVKKLVRINQCDYFNWDICTDYHFGGYAKFDLSLIEFINRFRRSTGIALDPVYTGKMMYGIYKMIEKGKFGDYENILAIHTGGLQGIAGFNQQFGDLIEVD